MPVVYNNDFHVPQNQKQPVAISNGYVHYNQQAQQLQQQQFKVVGQSQPYVHRQPPPLPPHQSSDAVVGTYQRPLSMHQAPLAVNGARMQMGVVQNVNGRCFFSQNIAGDYLSGFQQAPKQQAPMLVNCHSNLKMPLSQQSGHQLLQSYPHPHLFQHQQQMQPQHHNPHSNADLMARSINGNLPMKYGPKVAGE